VGLAQRHWSRPNAVDQLRGGIFISHLDIDHTEHSIGVRCSRRPLAAHVHAATAGGHGPRSVESVIHSVLHVRYVHRRSHQSHPQIMRTTSVSVQLVAVLSGGDERVPGVFG